MSQPRKATASAKDAITSTPSVTPAAYDSASEERAVDSQSAHDAFFGFSPTGLQDAWNLTWPDAAALAADAIVLPTVATRDASILALNVVGRIASDRAAATKFFELGETRFFDAARLRKLPVYARGLLYARAHLDTKVTASRALPTGIAQEATARRTRMLKVLGFYFGTDPAVAPELARIRGASGHSATAGALVSLAALYEQRRARIEHTPEFYLPTDAADAQRTASEIVLHLSAPSGNTRSWNDRHNRAWTVFLSAYNEVRSAGVFIFRDASDVEERFPSLHSLNAAKRPASKKSPANKPDERKPDAPAGDPQ